MNVGKEIALEAKKDKICQEAFSRMSKMGDIKQLCALYFEGSDWAMEKDFPRLETLKKFKGNSDQYGLFTDYKGGINNVQRVALFGKSNAEVVCDDFFAGEMVVRHDSKAKIKASGYAIVVVNILDNAFVEVEVTENAKVSIYNYSKDANFRITGNVEVKEGKFKAK